MVANLTRSKTVTKTQNNHFGQVIKDARLKKNFTLDTLCRKTNIPVRYLEKLEEQTTPELLSDGTIAALSFHLGLNEEELKRLAGKLTPEQTQQVKVAHAAYPEFADLVEMINRDPLFAIKIFKELENRGKN